MSFKDNEGKKPHFELHERFRAVNVNYFKQIHNGTFPPKHLIKLAQSYMDGTLNKADEKTEDVEEVSGLIQLKRCFYVYGFAICYFAARPHVALQLHEALTDHRIRLSDLSVHCRFDAIRYYHHAFVSARILNRQDDPMAWSTDNQGCSDLLVRKTFSQAEFAVASPVRRRKYQFQRELDGRRLHTT